MSAAPAPAKAIPARDSSEILSKVMFIDTETTGLVPHYNEIWQVCGYLYYRLKSREEVLVDTFKILMRPDHIDRVSPDLYAKGMIKEGQFLQPEYVSQKEGALKFAKFAEKYVDRFNTEDTILLVGHNLLQFDYPMLRAWWEMTDTKYFGAYYKYPALDTRTLAGLLAFSGEKNLPKKFNLKAVCDFYAVPFDEKAAHDAEYDVLATRKVFFKMLRQLHDLMMVNFKLIQEQRAASTAPATTTPPTPPTPPTEAPPA